LGHSGLVERVLSFTMLVIAWHLYQRLRVAWWIAEGILLMSLLWNFYIASRPFHGIVMVVDALLFGLLFFWRGDFCCPSGKRSLSRAGGFLLLFVAGMVGNAVISYHSVRVHQAAGVVHFSDSLVQTLRIMVGAPVSGVSHTLQVLIFWFSWLCILAALICAFRPFLLGKKADAADIQHARSLLARYGQCPCAYLTLEDDKYLYFGKQVDGVIAYGISGMTVIVNGDPVCAEKDFPILLAEFRSFCQQCAHHLLVLSASARFLDAYRAQGFGVSKCGEEARFYLPDYEISGKKGAKMRMNINHATKAGVTVHEYHVQDAREPLIDSEFDRISSEWLAGKKSSLLKFTVGGVGLDQPRDKRYFYALDKDGKMCAFVVFVPFMGTNGYMADVTRHGKDAPSGVMETIVYHAFQAFRDEGVAYGSLGDAPLANLDTDSHDPVEKLLEFVYEHLNDCYGFRDLYRAKEKYSPTSWEPSYYAYLPKMPLPSMFYALVRIQNSSGVLDFVKAFFEGKRKAHDKKKS
ncbi:MAG: phosphatidylglycerol lysyltransferase domain-containing protein, partial [Peptococcaceae bacterium]|nr:phosphatidylglycerol lysyltransferase domain-containing protein [Peptococcaceae bacterium]